MSDPRRESDNFRDADVQIENAVEVFESHDDRLERTRDLFAAHAMAALIRELDHLVPDLTAERAFEFADAMMKAREAGK